MDNSISKEDTRKRGKRLPQDKAPRGVRRYYPEWEYIEIGIDSDHIHLYMVTLQVCSK